MEISQLSFVLLGVYSVCFGVLLGIGYDIIRMLRALLGIEREEIKRIKKINFREIKLPLIKRTAYSTKRHTALKKASDVFVAIGDILFVTLCGVIVVLVAYAYNSGKVRAVIFVGLAIGFLLYYFTVGRLVMRLSELIVFVLRSIIVYLCELLKLMLKIIKNKKHRINKKERSKNDVRKNRRIKAETVSQ